MQITDNIQKSVAIATKCAKANAMAVSAETAIQNLIKTAGLDILDMQEVNELRGCLQVILKVQARTALLIVLNEIEQTPCD